MESRGPGPFKSLLGNLILDYLGYKQGATVNSDVPELAQIPIMTALRREEGAVILLIGARGTGNTTEALRIAEIIGRPTYGVFPEQPPPPWVTQLKFSQLSEKPPPFSTLILDDIGGKGGYMGKRDYSNHDVRVVETMIPMVRHTRKLILIFRAQTSKQADLSIADSDIISFKSLNPAFFDTERSGILRIYRDIDPIFRQMSEYQEKRHCYLVHRKWHGMASIAMPGWDQPKS